MPHNTTSIRVLVVDGNRCFADALGVSLRAHGLAVRVAYSAEEGAAAADEFTPDAAISEAVMPGMSGVDLDLWMRENHPACRMLLVSNEVAVIPMVEESERRGRLHTVLPKPDPRELILPFIATCLALPLEMEKRGRWTGHAARVAGSACRSLSAWSHAVARSSLFRRCRKHGGQIRSMMWVPGRRAAVRVG